MPSILLLLLAPSAALSQVSVQLDPLFFEQCRRPCQYVGFSFSESPAAMLEMREHGANAVGMGSMWVPTDDPTAPDGCGVPSVMHLRDMLQVGQSFTVDEPFTGVALCTPTFNTEGSGCTLSLYAKPPEAWGQTPPEPLATHVFPTVKDNQRLWLTFDALPPGSYYVEQSAPTGQAIGAWSVAENPYGGGQAYLSRQAADEDLELWARTAAGETALSEPSGGHHALRLGGSTVSGAGRAELSFDYLVGNWNNGGFPYYPKWFIERFPEHAMLDQNGQPILSGMFGDLAPWPNIDNAVIADGTERHIRAVVEALRDNPNLLYWCMGGEALYATYLMPSRWTDYSEDALAHYRAWLRQEYRSVEALNRAWGTQLTDFGQVDPPRPPARDLPTLDWFRYRNLAMAERFRLHFAATKGADPSRLVVTCNHGNLFRDMSATWLGEDLALFAGVSDGWEMGQIMADSDPDLYNLMWMRSAGIFGKPLCPVRLAYKKSDPHARGGGTSYTPETARRYFWESVGTGAWHMGFIQWSGSLPDGEWGVKGTPAQQEIADIFREWHAIEGYFDDAWPVREPVGLYLSQLTWTLDGFQPLWTRLHRELTQRQIGYRILQDEQLRTGDLEGLSTIISAENPVMSRECADALREFAAGGGKLVAIGRNALEDERLAAQPRDPLGTNVTRLEAAAPTLVDDLERIVEGPRLVTVDATPDRPYIAQIDEALCGYHDTPYDLSGHGSIGQTFTTAQAGLRSIGVSNPTYTKTVTDHELTLELREGGPEGRVIAAKTYGAEDLTDNAWHTVTLDAPAPPGTYYLRLVTPKGLPAQTLGAWGTRDDSYAGGSLYLDDTPAAGDLELRLGLDTEKPARAALEAFTLSDGTNAIVVLTNITDLRIEAEARLSPTLLPEASYLVRDLATGAELGRVRRDQARAKTTVAPHRSAVLFFGAAEPGNVEARLAEVEAAVAKLPPEATGAQRAHLQRAREALAAGRPGKALACLRRAKQRAPLAVSARLERQTLHIRAETFGPGAEEALAARLVPLPGVRVPLTRAPGGVYVGSVSLAGLTLRYDYRNRDYLPYWGGLEVIVSGRLDGRLAAGSCVVNIGPWRPGVG